MYKNKRLKLSKAEFTKSLQNLKLISMDADGTITDGSMYIDNNGNQFRRFNAHDGIGISMLKEIGIYIVLLTTSRENVFSIRSEIINCDKYISGSFNKGEALESLCKDEGIPLENAMHVGDDVNDISAFLKVGFPVSVNNAVDIVKDVSCYVTSKNGGFGALREICDLVMIAKTGKPFGAPYVSEEVYNKINKL